MIVPQYTTPQFTLTFTEENLDLREADNVYVTFSGKFGIITKTGDSLTVGEKSIAVGLSQEETAKFVPNSTVEIQANWTTGNRHRAASDVAEIEIGMQLLQEVIE